MAFFPGFTLETVTLPQGPVRLRRGGSGPALLLLHGHPRTHATWARVAPLLADRFTVVCPDLPGFGESYQPGDLQGSSKRAKAAALAALMTSLGYDRFAVAGHDRGSYTAFRMAMDHTERVTSLTLIDGVPILEALERADWRFARDWFHWFFFTQTEKALAAVTGSPDLWYPLDPASMGAENHGDAMRATRDPAVVAGMLADYRAGVEIDHLHDADDRTAGRRIACPTRILWSLGDDMERIYGDPLAVWRPWVAHALDGFGVASGHHVAEQAPEPLAAAIAEAARRN